MRRFSSHFAAAFFLIAFHFDTPAFALHPEEAFALSRQTGKPLLALGTSATCPPCHALKHHLRNEPSIQPLLTKYIVINMDSSTPEFRSFVRRFPAEVRGVPMVYVIRPDGVMLYGKSGGMRPEGLEKLLSFGLEESGEPLSSEQQERFSAVIAESERYQRDGDLLKAMQAISGVAEHPGYAASVTLARVLRDTLLDSLTRRLAVFDKNLVDSERMHGAAYRLAELYIALRDVPQLREPAGAMLVHYEKQEATRLAILQGKELVRARYFEQRELCRQALSSYERIIQIDAASPTAQHANQKIAIIKDKQREKIVRNDHRSFGAEGVRAGANLP